jgi:hypothetical protein
VSGKANARGKDLPGFGFEDDGAAADHRPALAEEDRAAFSYRDPLDVESVLL